MAVNKTDRYDWQNASATDKLRFKGKISPNSAAHKDYLLKRYGGTSLGILNQREVRGGGALSTHAFGAAFDWRYPTRSTALIAIKDLVAHSKEWGIQMIVDYVGGTVWTSTGGWKKQQSNKHGMGQSWARWLHIESTKTDWKNSKGLTER